MLLTKSRPIPTTHTTERTTGRNYQGLVLLLLITLGLMGGIGTRLVHLQLLQGKTYEQEAKNNRIRVIPKHPGRGKILDRHGKILAGSSLSHSVYLWPLASRKTEWPTTLKRLSEILNIPESEIQNRLDKAEYSSPYLLRIARGLTAEEVTALAEYSRELEGIEVDVEAAREYPYKEVASHVLGYTGEINEEDLEKTENEGYRLGDIVGQMGIEAALEEELRGGWGGREVEVDSKGQVVRILDHKAAQAGDDVQLTLDLDLQMAAEAALGDNKGAIVAMNPQNGEVLAMASNPKFDPNIFSGRISEDQWKEVQGRDHPFVNRALQGFPPASTFKIVTTAAAIESGIFSPYTVLGTFPYVQVGGIKFWDWNRAGFGPLDFRGAMAWSSDTFFYQIAQGIGGEILIDWTRRFGFGRKTGIELEQEEAAGLVADDAWKRENIGYEWFVGDTVNMSIGQGFLLSSPLQVAVMFAVVANGGDLVKPHLVKQDGDDRIWRESLGLSPITVQILQDGLRQVVSAGTGGVMNSLSLPINAGKTGTAEDPPRLSHAWYGGYAPLDNPEVVIVAFGENSGGGGGKFAAPKVRQVMEAYFQLKKQRQAE
ncbi:penicillin-binding protein 2 [Roseofilum sp. BLCC_M154]|uniref:Penicillin-binding protein 2 n=1 Tax=Roseofilum acuticapitatum BLCC-M154 TaxID=3022444 RepID=A0ABT7AWG1_9CYAN|nr:penicillin-binding protein 2 [Roseofilum acuticapitatum]MDJ1171255.1 penicillin-binding protein 2 [Roseofilum acuticapitatum BLCC-M154]